MILSARICAAELPTLVRGAWAFADFGPIAGIESAATAEIEIKKRKGIITREPRYIVKQYSKSWRGLFPGETPSAGGCPAYRDRAIFECIGFHGKNRWIAKTDLTPVPLNKSAIQSVTASQIYAWEGPGPNVDLTPYSETRMPSEQKWYALTGRVVDAKVEADGDIHIALVDANGNKVGTVSGSFAFS